MKLSKSKFMKHIVRKFIHTKTAQANKMNEISSLSFMNPKIYTDAISIDGTVGHVFVFLDFVGLGN